MKQRRCPPKAEVVGSNPTGCAIVSLKSLGFYNGAAASVCRNVSETVVNELARVGEMWGNDFEGRRDNET